MFTDDDTEPMSHRRKAVQQLWAIKAAQDGLAELYDSPGRPNPAQIARLHDAVRTGIRLAQVQALLAIAEAITLNGPRTRGLT